MATRKVKIYELAKEVGLSSTDLITFLNDRLRGRLEAKTALSVVPDEIAAAVRVALSEKVGAAARPEIDDGSSAGARRPGLQLESVEPVPTLVAWDLDQTLCDTSTLAASRKRRDWKQCRTIAPTLPFYPGIEDTLEWLDAQGVTFNVATRTPEEYLQAFIKRLPVTASQTHSYRWVAPHSGLTAAESLRFTQLKSFQNASVLTLRVYIGDEASDAVASFAAGWVFLHACWGATRGTPDAQCAAVDAKNTFTVHCPSPDHVVVAVDQLRQRFVPLLVDGTPPIQVNQTPFGGCGRAGYLDYYFPVGVRKDDCVRDCVFRFKNNEVATVAAVCKAAASAARAMFSRDEVTHVVPVLGSKDKNTNARSPNAQLARSIAASLGADLDLNAFAQSESRSKLHLSGGYANRSKILREVLCHLPRPGRRVLLVDDVITTGASLETYADMLERGGATVAGAFAIARTDSAGRREHFNDMLMSQILELD